MEEANEVVKNVQEVMDSEVVDLVQETTNSGFGWEKWLLVVAVVIIGWAAIVYNFLIQLRVKVNQAWSNIDVQLKRRYDLIPNLVETVKGYAQHERETLEAVISARNKATEIKIDAKNLTAENMAQFAGAQQGLTGALSKLFALSEKYPDLKADKNFLELQRQLEDTEDKIESSRAGYNGAVADYNIKVQMFPGNIIAGIFKFQKREMFEIENEVEKKNVKV